MYNFIGPLLTIHSFYWSNVTRQNVFGSMKKTKKKNILAALYYKPPCSKPGIKVAVYNPEFMCKLSQSLVATIFSKTLDK